MTFRSRLAALAAVCLVPLAAQATVVLSETIEQLAINAHVIVRGKAGPSEARWNDARTRIETWTEITVSDVIKGRLNGPVRVRQVGGIIGKAGMSVAGEASFTEGEEVVLFLDRPGDDGSIFVVRSMSYGKMTVEKTPLGDVRVYRDAKGLGLYEPKDSNVRLVNSREDLGNVDSFIGRLKRALAKKGGLQ